MEFDVKPNSRISSATKQVQLRVKEEKDKELGTDQHPDTENHVDPTLPLSPTGGNDYKWQKRLNNSGEWQDTSEAFTTPNLSQSDTVNYRVLWPWNTSKPIQLDSKLWDHNGAHTVALVSATAGQKQVRFEAADDPADSIVVKDFYERKVPVQNLVIEGVSTSSGNGDYFKFDSSAEEGSDLKQPFVSFTIADSDAHSYKWRVRVRSTDKDDDWNDSVLISGTAETPKTITARVNYHNPAEQTQVSDRSSNPATDPTAYAALDEWGTYTFDISVEEFDEQGRSLGRAESYRSQKLFIPRQMPDGSGRGHSGQMLNDANDVESYRVNYYFHDTSPSSANAQVKSMKIEMLSTDMARVIASSDGNWGKTVETGYYDKLLHTFAPQPRELGTTITLFMAQDTHAVKYRNHQNKRSLVKNDRASKSRIESVVWEEINSPLDDNPADMGGGKRIFPDKSSPDDTKENDLVRIKAKITPVKAGVKLYFQGFDVDDPSISNETDIPASFPASTRKVKDVDSPDGGDNMLWNADFTPLPDKNKWTIKEVLTDSNGFATYTYRLNRSAGDNYRVAVAMSEEPIKKLTIKSDPAEGFYFVSADNGQIAEFDGRISEMLTVWRHLHIERDSMRAPQGNENKVVGRVTQIETLPDNSMRATVRIPYKGSDQNLVNSREYVQEQEKNGAWINDKSHNLDDAIPGNGRFENGSILIGLEGNAAKTEDLKGNGVAYIATKPDQKIALPFVLSMAGKPELTGRISALGALQNRSVFTLTFAGNAVLTPNDYVATEDVKAQLSVAGHNFVVLSNSTNQVIVEETNVELDFVLMDDDQLLYSDGTDLLPHLPAFGNVLVKLFEQVYIVPVLDGGGNESNNKETMEFRRNISWPSLASDLEGGFESKANYAGDYWVVNLLTVYQSGTFDEHKNRSDADANNEGTAGAFAERGGLSTVQCREDYRDSNWGVDDSREQQTWVHEIGHLFGLPDRYNNDQENFGLNNLMGSYSTDKFLNRDKWLLRSRRPGAGP